MRNLMKSVLTFRGFPRRKVLLGASSACPHDRAGHRYRSRAHPSQDLFTSDEHASDVGAKAGVRPASPRWPGRQRVEWCGGSRRGRPRRVVCGRCLTRTLPLRRSTHTSILARYRRWCGAAAIGRSLTLQRRGPRRSGGLFGSTSTNCAAEYAFPVASYAASIS